MRRALLAAYRVLLRVLLPSAFRAEYGEELQASVRFRLGSRRGRLSATLLGTMELLDLFRTAGREWAALGTSWARGFLIGISMDLRVAGRGLIATPGFSIIAISTLAIAIGANAAIFSVIDTVLLDPLAFPEADRLVSIRGTAPGSELPEEFGVGAEFYVQYRENAAALEDLGTYLTGEMTVRSGDHVERLPVSAVSPSLFSTLGVRPVLGRLPTDQDEDAQVVVLSYWLWTSWFGRDPRVIGESIEVASGPRTVVGVMGPEFGFPHERNSLWLHDVPTEPVRPGGFGLDLVGRLAPAADHATLAAELAPLARRLPERFGGSVAYARIIERHRPVVRSLEDHLVGDIATPLWILLGTVAIVLLIACANVTNLFLVRAESRRRSLAVRRALGADRADLIRAQMIEALLVAALGGGGAVVIALAGLPLLVRAAPDSIPRLGSAGLDLTALAFTAAVVLLAAFTSGILPALRFSNTGFGGAQRSDGRATQFTRSALVVAQSAAALVLLVGSALLIQSFVALRQVDPGYETEDILTFKMAPDLPAHGIVDGASLAQFHYMVMDRLAELPAVESVGLAYTLPLDEGAESNRFATEFTDASSAVEPLVRSTFAGGDYFRTMGIDLLEGGDFEPTATPSDEPRAIVSLSAANLLWPGDDPLGKRFRRAGPDSLSWIVVSGVVEDVILEDFRQAEPEPLIYLPMVGHTERSWGVFTPNYVVKSASAGEMGPEVRQLIHEIAPEAPIYHMSTLSALAAQAVARLTFTMLTLGIAAAIALILGAVGLYGVLAYVVSQRTREIGIRMALGARATGLRRMIVAQGSSVALIGVLLGLIMAVTLTRVLESLLYGVPAVHGPTFTIAAALMLGVAMLASYVPARRASSVDPVRALGAQ